MGRITCWIALILTLWLWGGIFSPSYDAGAQSVTDQVREILRARLTRSSKPKRLLCRKELLCGPNVLLRFYARRAFQPAWSADEGQLPQAATLVKEVRAAVQEGLRPEDYHLVNIENLLTEIQQVTAKKRPIEPEMLADLELLLTDAFILYGSHLLAGHVNPETIQSEWVIESREADLDLILQAALDTGGVEKALENLRPQHTGYAGLKEALARHEELMRMGGWPAVPQGPKMEIGDSGLRVSALRSRLVVSGDLEAAEQSDHDLFDGVLEEAVRRFQKRHGLEVDGIVGKATLNALNVPLSDRVDQIKLNMERWRWLPQDLGWRYILVNIANFELDIVENNRIVMTMRVVVGRRYRRTPVFTGTMTYMELNPYWHVPTKIATRDILPSIQKDPQYLADKNIRVFKSWEAGAPEIEPASIDWSQVKADNFPFKLLQDPGPWNALGHAKFMFPNKFSVYLHDTPAQALFQKTKRSFSSGCIRIEKPIDLATYLLRDDPEWTRERIQARIESGETRIVRIPEPIPVHLLYWTAWIDSAGTLHFRDDIYERDKRLDLAFNERPPTP